MSILDPRAAQRRPRPTKRLLPSARFIAVWNLVWFGLTLAALMALAVFA